MADEVLLNSSEQKNITVPEDVKEKFNWGAFLLTWIWGIGNKTYITLIILASMVLAFIPFVNLITGFVQLGLSIWFGIKGNEWAWRNKNFESVESFHSYQKKWAIAGIIVAVLSIICIAVFTLFVMIALMSGITAE